MIRHLLARLQFSVKLKRLHPRKLLLPRKQLPPRRRLQVFRHSRLTSNSNLAHEMEHFLRSLDLSHVSTWQRVFRMFLERGGKRWKGTGQTFVTAILCSSSLEVRGRTLAPLIKLFPETVRSKTEMFYTEKSFVSFLCSSFNVRVLSSSDKTTYVAASSLISLAPAIVCSS